MFRQSDISFTTELIIVLKNRPYIYIYIYIYIYLNLSPKLNENISLLNDPIAKSLKALKKIGRCPWHSYFLRETFVRNLKIVSTYR